MNILEKRWDKYTTTGNDGIIDYIFSDVLQHNNCGFFVEFGARDGITGSNCRRLFDMGWGGVFIESDKKEYKILKRNYKDITSIFCCNKKVGLAKGKRFDDILDSIIDTTGKSIDKIDFCSIDIDGLDVDVFETFDKFLPDVVCIEGGQMLHPFHKRVSSKVSSNNIQQSLSVMNEVFGSKGYKLLCSYQDSFFIKNTFFHLFEVDDDIMNMYFCGIEAIPHRLPFIDKKIREVGLKNPIITSVLNHSMYKKYGWKNRKIWIKENKDKVIEYINTLRGQYVEKRSC